MGDVVVGVDFGNRRFSDGRKADDVKPDNFHVDKLYLKGFRRQLDGYYMSIGGLYSEMDDILKNGSDSLMFGRGSGRLFLEAGLLKKYAEISDKYIVDYGMYDKLEELLWMWVSDEILYKPGFENLPGKIPAMVSAKEDNLYLRTSPGVLVDLYIYEMIENEIGMLGSINEYIWGLLLKMNGYRQEPELAKVLTF